MSVIVFWISRHEPLPAQIERLREILGNYELKPIIGRIPNAEYIDRIVTSHDADRKIVIPVLPLSMIAKLVNLGKKHGYEVWWAEMREIRRGSNMTSIPQIDPTRQAILPTDGGWKIVEFVRFRRIVDFRIIFEEVQ